MRVLRAVEAANGRRLLGGITVKLNLVDENSERKNPS